MQKVVSVGASLAGLRCAQAPRKRGFGGKVVLLGAEQRAPDDRPPLSKQLLSGDWPAESYSSTHACSAAESGGETRYSKIS
jgi:3-phenylpropionate/trans-cinnamate dioxygenase ferredoxin reductase subunit